MPTSWSQEKYMRYVDEQINQTKGQLKSFVGQVYWQMRVATKNPECVVEFKPFVDTAIIDYAVLRKVNSICMSTRGAGLIKRVLGTNTSSVLSKSPIPVLAVPHDYRRSQISDILYASDLTALSTELKQVKKFADDSKSKLSVVHYGHLLEPAEMKRNLETMAKRYRASGVRFRTLHVIHHVQTCFYRITTHQVNGHMDTHFRKSVIGRPFEAVLNQPWS
jgi:hypothetical protein